MFFSGSSSSQALVGFWPLRCGARDQRGSSLVTNQKMMPITAIASAQTCATACHRRRPDERRDEFRDRRADIAGAENAERGALLAGRIPSRDIGDADRERAARDADAERGDQELRIGLRVGQELCCNRRRQHHRV